MRRKVIQIADSTQLVSLPRKWALKYGVKKGDELEINVEEDRLTISTDKCIQFAQIDVDISGLDRTSILYCIQGLYRMGYDEIKVEFKNAVTDYIRTKQKVNVISVLHYVVSRLPGFEIIQQRDNFCVIKDIQEVSKKEFDSMLKRIFLLLTNAYDDLINGIKAKDYVALETIKEKHDSITKFVSYSLRLLNKVGYEETKKNFILYHVLSNIDKIADVLKSTSRHMIDAKLSLNKEQVTMMEKIAESVKVYLEIYDKFELKGLHRISDLKEDVTTQLSKLPKTVDNATLFFLSNSAITLEILTDLTESRWALEY